MRNEAALAAGLAACAVSALVFVLLYPYFSADRKGELRLRGLSEGSGPNAGQAARDMAANRRKQVTEYSEGAGKPPEGLGEGDFAPAPAEGRHRQSRQRSIWLASAAFGLTLALIINLTLPAPPPGHSWPSSVGSWACFGVPRWFVALLTKRRQAKFIEEFANAIDIIVRGVKSGLPLNECLGMIAREVAEPLAGEFREVVEQQSMGVTLGEALERMATRMPLPEVRFLTIVIAIQQQAGGNLSEALGNLSSVLRERNQLQAEGQGDVARRPRPRPSMHRSLPPASWSWSRSRRPDYIGPLFTTRRPFHARLRQRSGWSSASW